MGEGISHAIFFALDLPTQDNSQLVGVREENERQQIAQQCRREAAIQYRKLAVVGELH